MAGIRQPDREFRLRRALIDHAAEALWRHPVQRAVDHEQRHADLADLVDVGELVLDHPVEGEQRIARTRRQQHRGERCLQHQSGRLALGRQLDRDGGAEGFAIQHHFILAHALPRQPVQMRAAIVVEAGFRRLSRIAAIAAIADKQDSEPALQISQHALMPVA